MMGTQIRQYRKGGNAEEKTTKKGNAIARSKSFDVEDPSSVGFRMPRRRTASDLAAIASGGAGLPLPEARDYQPKKLTKLLLKVTIQGSVGPVHLLMSPESTARDIIAVALRQYDKEGRRPRVTSTDPIGFDLHFSQFSLESLNREEKVADLGSRNFFVCPKRCSNKEVIEDGNNVNFTTSCSEQVQKSANINLPLVNFMFTVMKYSV